MRVGLLSDTHGYLDARIYEYFKECDEVWHAGDIGGVDVLHALQAFKPIRAVFGNIDTQELQHSLPEDLWFECEGLLILLTHIGGAPPKYNSRIKKVLKERTPAVFICGHSHILRVVRDSTYKMLYINPGAAGNHGFHYMKTIMRFEVIEKEIRNMEVIELGRRGQIKGE